jgi:hypothetical protein
MGQQVYSCELGESSGGVGTGGILVIECKVSKFGWVMKVWSLCESSSISLSVELVPEFNYFKKLQVFKFLNPVRRFPSKVVHQNEIWQEEILKWRDCSEQPLKSEQKSFLKTAGRCTSG